MFLTQRARFCLSPPFVRAGFGWRERRPALLVDAGPDRGHNVQRTGPREARS
jgi:hypothetical protein